MATFAHFHGAALGILGIPFVWKLSRTNREIVVLLLRASHVFTSRREAKRRPFESRPLQKRDARHEWTISREKNMKIFEKFKFEREKCEESIFIWLKSLRPDNF